MDSTPGPSTSLSDGSKAPVEIVKEFHDGLINSINQICGLLESSLNKPKIDVYLNNSQNLCFLSTFSFN
jgi:hypothetical protein